MCCRNDGVDVDFLARLDIQRIVDAFFVTYRRSCKLNDSIDATHFIVVNDSVDDTVEVSTLRILEIVREFRLSFLVDDAPVGTRPSVVRFTVILAVIRRRRTASFITLS